MNKKIISLLLCLCIALSLLPMAAFATETDTGATVESVTFGYAYDVMRSPSFPSQSNEQLTIYNLKYPYLANGRQGSTNQGTWTLTNAGTYADVLAAGKATENLTAIVNAIASRFSVSASAVVVHQLKDGDTHVAYGIVAAYDPAQLKAIFLGDSLGSGGAGYLLSAGAVTQSSITMTATQMATDFMDPSSRPSNEPHTCTKCSICGYCLDPACANDACMIKCLNLTMYFSDVPAGQWYYEGVNYVYHRGMMNGVGGALFDPSGITNRAMLVTILWRLEGSPAPTTQKTFADVPTDSWYNTAVRWAASNGIVEGYGNGYFGPEHKLTREEFATILYRYAKFKGYDVSNSKEIIYFVDVNQVGNYAVPALKWAYAEGIITGKTSVTLDPRGGATRAEAATILMRFCQKYAAGGYIGGTTGDTTTDDSNGDTGSSDDNYGDNYEGDWGWG